MSSIAKETRLRNEGMELALMIAKRDGIDGLEQECKNRGCYGNIKGKLNNLSSKELSNASQEIKLHVTKVCIALTEQTLREKFYFNETQCVQFAEYFTDLVEMYVENKTKQEELLKNTNFNFEGGVLSET